MKKFNVKIGQDFYSALEDRGLLEYGSVIIGIDYRALLGIEIPEVASKKVFDELQLFELNATGYVRDTLLKQGKYLGQQNGDYRVFLPSENARQIESYMNSADRKLRRAMLLSRNTPHDGGSGATVSLNIPHDGGSGPDTINARLLMKREGIKQTRQHMDGLR